MGFTNYFEALDDLQSNVSLNLSTRVIDFNLDFVFCFIGIGICLMYSINEGNQPVFFEMI